MERQQLDMSNKNIGYEKSIRRLERFARLMESSWRLPFTEIRFGLDFIIGLIPFLGDLFTGLLSLWLVKEAKTFQLPRRVYLKMILNVVLDVCLGLVPVLGDFFDLAFRANKRNVDLVLKEIKKIEGGSR